MKVSFALFLLLSLTFSLFAYEKNPLEFSLKRYLEFISKNPDRLYDTINSKDNSRYVNEYRLSLEQYIKSFESKVMWRKEKKVKLFPETVNVFPVWFDKERLLWAVCNIDTFLIVKIDENKLNILFKEDIYPITDVSMVDIENDGRNEIIALNNNFLYIIRLSRTGKIYLRKIKNNEHFIKIFEAKNKVYGITNFSKLTDEHGLGHYFCELEWVHPGFGVKKIIRKVDGYLFLVQGSLWEITNELGKMVLKKYRIDNSELKEDEKYYFDSDKTPITFFRIKQKPYVVFYDGVYRFDFGDEKLINSQKIYSAIFIKSAFKISGDRIYVIDISNRLFNIVPPEKVLPVFASKN